MSVKAVEGWSYTEAWCENCGWRTQSKDRVDAMAAAEDHWQDCVHDDPAVLGEDRVLWEVGAR